MGRVWLSYLLTVIFASFLFSLLFWLMTPQDQKDISYASPLPDFLTLAKNPQVRFLDLWLPAIANAQSSQIHPPNVTAKAVLMYDLNSGKTIYGKNIKTRLPMASLTKIMTAIISLENKKADDKYVITQQDLVGEDSMGLSSGEILSQEELLYGLFLNSGNDAAEALASNFSGGRPAFVQAMNDKVKALGLFDTHFTNPTGLQGDGDQYTTAYDLLVMTGYGIENFPEFTQVAATVDHILPQTTSHKEYDLHNETNLLTTYPGVKGLKTGYTPDAGYCLITYLEYDGHSIIGIILNSQDRRNEMKALLDYSLGSLGDNPPPMVE